MRFSDEAERPATLVAALALTALTGVANMLVGGVVLTLLRLGVEPDRLDLARPIVLTIGCGYLLLGALTLGGAAGLLARTPGSRVFVTVVMMLRIGVACISFGVVGTWYSAGSVLGIVVAVVVIALLWDSRANAYFHVSR